MDLGQAIHDASCVFTDETKADALRQDYERRFSGSSPAVEGSLLPDGTIELRIMNRGATALVLPLFLSQAVDTFAVTVSRQGRQHRLPSATLIAPSGTADWGLSGRNFARIVIAPNGLAFVRLTIDPTVVEDSLAGCPPNAKCAASRSTKGPLPSGAWTLAIELPIYGVPRPAANIAWTMK